MFNSGSDLLARLRELEARAVEMDHRLVHAQRLATLGTIAGIIAHEFNNVLTPVMSYAQLALAHPEDSELNRKALEKTAAGVSQASKVASAILGFVRPEESLQVSDVEKVVRDAVECMARDPRKDGIALDVDIAPGCAAAIQPVALQQVLLNLLLNSREAMTPGGGSLKISAERSTWNTPDGPPTAAVVLRVKDSGRGIPEAKLAEIFRPFVRADEGASPGGHSGAGLGLALCKHLINEAGGEISVSSKQGDGAEFTIRLPVASSPASALAGAA